MKRVVYVFSLLGALLLAGCQDDTEDLGGDSKTATLKAPVLERRGVPQDDLVSLAAIVEEDQIAGTIHYVAFKEKNHEGKPTPQELMDSRYREEVPLNGATIKKFNFPASSKTKYFIYAILAIGDEVSAVAELQAETI